MCMTPDRVRDIVVAEDLHAGVRLVCLAIVLDRWKRQENTILEFRVEE